MLKEYSPVMVALNIYLQALGARACSSKQYSRVRIFFYFHGEYSRASKLLAFLFSYGA